MTIKIEDITQFSIKFEGELLSTLIPPPFPSFLNGKELRLFGANLFPFVILKSVNYPNIIIIFLSYAYI